MIMSHLLSFDTKTIDLNSLVWKPSGATCFEDHYSSNFMNAVSFLRLSEKRKSLQHSNNGDIFDYVSSLYKLMDTHTNKTDNKIKRLENTKPIVFTWNINGTDFYSTSLNFELYCATQVAAHKKFITGLTSMDPREKKTNFKDAIDYLKELPEILKKWETKTFVLPHCPVQCNSEYVKKSLYVIKGFKALCLLHDAKSNNIQGNILNTAMNFFSSSWLRQEVFGALSIQHYFLTRALLYKDIAFKHNDDGSEEYSSKALTAINESLYCSNQITESLCYVLPNTMNAIVNTEDLVEKKNTLETVNYAVACDLSNITLPKAVPISN